MDLAGEIPSHALCVSRVALCFYPLNNQSLHRPDGLPVATSFFCLGQKFHLGLEVPRMGSLLLAVTATAAGAPFE
jgi:hypothetical protein